MLLIVLATVPLFAQWTSTPSGTKAIVTTSDSDPYVVIGGPQPSGNPPVVPTARLTIKGNAGSETFRYAPNPGARVLDLDYNNLVDAVTARNGAAMRVDLRWGAPDNFYTLPVFQWWIRGEGAAPPSANDYVKMYLDRNGTLGIGYTDAAGVGTATATPPNSDFGASQKLLVNGGVAFGYGTYVADMKAAVQKLLVNGSVGIGYDTVTVSNIKTAPEALRVNGSARFEQNVSAAGTISGGNVIAKYQDVAEWVPASEELNNATVVILDPDHSNYVRSSYAAYDETVAGVVSARPGILLGEEGASKVKVATTGRVKVKVDATKTSIKIGDLLVTSDKPGMAMKSERIEVAGVKLHRPGTVIGKALEPLPSGEGEILVLLSLQ